MNRDNYTKEELLEARERNTNSRKYKNDSVWESNQCGSFIIIGRLDSRHLYIQFLNTNAIYVKGISAIATGNVKDSYVSNIYSKGFIGEGKYSFVSHKVLYKRWYSMLKRVYSDKYPTYNDCTINEHWLNFQNFARDIEELMEEKGISSLEGYVIDKDIKSNGNKIYSKETVSLITPLENVKEMHSRIHNTVYVAKNLISGEEIEFSNQMQFARDHNLNQRNISSVLNGKRKSTGGFTFYEKGEKAPDMCPYVAENIKTGEILEFSNQSQFAKEHGINNTSISSVLNGKGKTVGGWKVKRKEEQPV